MVEVEAVGVNPVDVGNRADPSLGRHQPRRTSWATSSPAGSSTPASRCGRCCPCAAPPGARWPSASPSRASTSRHARPSCTRSSPPRCRWPGAPRCRCCSGCRWRPARGCWSTERPEAWGTCSCSWPAASGCTWRPRPVPRSGAGSRSSGSTCGSTGPTPSPAAAAAEHLGGELDAVVDLVGGLLEPSLPFVRVGGHAATIVDLAGDLDLAIDRNIDLHGVLVRPGRDRLYELSAAVASGLRPT